MFTTILLIQFIFLLLDFFIRIKPSFSRRFLGLQNISWGTGRIRIIKNTQSPFFDENPEITEIEWYFNHYAPYVPDVLGAAQKDREIVVKQDYSMYGTPESVITLKNDKEVRYRLSESEQEVIDIVIEETMHLTWNAFINKVYSTSPIKNGKRYKTLD